MAITVRKQPKAEILGAQSDILYVVTSNSSSNDNYTFNMDVCDEDGNMLQRFQQTPNLDGIGVFNLNSYIKRKVQIPMDDTNFWVGSFSLNYDQINRNQIKFSEAWSDTPSGDIVIYNGIDDTELSAGNPGHVSASNLGPDPNNYFIPAVVNRNEQLDENFKAGNWYNEGTATGAKLWITDMPREDIEIYSDDIMLLGAFFGPEKSGSGAYNDIWKVKMKTYTANGTLNNSYENQNWQSGGGDNPDSARVAQTTNYSALTAEFFKDGEWDNRFAFYGVGPQNIQSYLADADDATATITVTGYNGGAETTGIDDTLNFKIMDNVCDVYDRYRLCWVNKYGALDWYNFRGRSRYTVNRSDTQYRKGFVNYGLESFTADPYDISRRGTTNFLSTPNQRVSVSTKFLTQDWANFLEGLFSSPNVYLQFDTSTMIPVVLTSATYTKKDDPRTEKLRQYNVTFEYANPQRSRL